MPSTHKTIKTSILIISDTHAVNLTNHPGRPETIIFSPPFPKADVVLHCGDLTNSGRLREFIKTIDTIAKIDAELKLIIAGNHDLSLDDEYMRNGGPRWVSRAKIEKQQEKDAETRSCKALLRSVETRRKGIVFLDEGMHRFTLSNDAELKVRRLSSFVFTLIKIAHDVQLKSTKIYASPYTPEFCDWAFAYEHTEDRWNPADKVSPNATSIAKSPIPDFPKVDIVMTHGPPAGHLDSVLCGISVGCEHLKRALRRSRPQVHCFGHIHESWGAEKVRWYEDRDDDDDDDKKTHGPSAVNGESKQKTAIDMEQCKRERVANVNLSSFGPNPLLHGHETLMVNASIMNLYHRPFNPPWLIDIDLSAANE